MIEVHHLTDGKGNVWSHVGQEIQQHFNDGQVTPVLFHRFAFGINTKCLLGAGTQLGLQFSIFVIVIFFLMSPV
jgi:hypothetical protein